MVLTPIASKLTREASTGPRVALEPQVAPPDTSHCSRRKPNADCETMRDGFTKITITPRIYGVWGGPHVSDNCRVHQERA